MVGNDNSASLKSVLGRSLVKSLVYRAITLVLGFTTAYVFTQDPGSATLISLLTEAVQAVNYFIYESTWSYFAERRLRKKIRNELKEKIVNLKLNMEAIKSIAKEFSRIDTFNPIIYNSVISFYDRILQNKDLDELHEDFNKYKKAFRIMHRERQLCDEEEEEDLEEKDLDKSKLNKKAKLGKKNE